LHKAVENSSDDIPIFHQIQIIIIAQTFKCRLAGLHGKWKENVVYENSMKPTKLKTTAKTGNFSVLCDFTA